MRARACQVAQSEQRKLLTCCTKDLILLDVNNVEVDRLIIPFFRNARENMSRVLRRRPLVRPHGPFPMAPPEVYETAQPAASPRQPHDPEPPSAPPSGAPRPGPPHDPEPP